MYSLTSRLPTRELLLRHAPTLAGALVITEMFYKWHSFVLEAVGCVLTWYMLDLTRSFIGGALKRRTATQPPL